MSWVSRALFKEFPGSNCSSNHNSFSDPNPLTRRSRRDLFAVLPCRMNLPRPALQRCSFSRSTQTTCSLKPNSRPYFRTLWWYIQRTRLIRSLIVRITLWIHGTFDAHPTKKRFSLRYSSTTRPQRPISTLSRTPGHHSTHLIACRSHRIRTGRAAST